MSSRPVKRSESQFRVDPLNTLGRDMKKTRAKLYAQALKDPQAYIKMRENVIDKVVDKMITQSYNTFWELMKDGKVGGTQLYLPDDAEEFLPGVPEQEIGKVTLSISETIESICEDVVSHILPANHKDLALRKIDNQTQLEMNGGGSA